MEENPEIELAYRIIEETGTHLFLTGKAGTGKTTFLKELIRKSSKRIVVVAPTGIAAINAGGVTIHSFFQLPFAPYIPGTKLNFKFNKNKRAVLRNLDVIVIDEVSMVRADTLDSIDHLLRRYKNPMLPFGGVQLLMIGDLQQLAPVINENDKAFLSSYYDAPFFFYSKALQMTNYKKIELKKVYRQNDKIFIELLNSIRENRINESVIAQLNARYIPNFDPPKEEQYIRLVTHNNQANAINEAQLSLLPGKTYSFKARVEDNFPEYSYPTEEVLRLKAGAQIMFVKNDPDKRFYNGLIGEIVDIDERRIKVKVKDREEEFYVHQEEWLNCKYALNKSTQVIDEVIEGRFMQYPIRLAWAITVHKSQGLTFDKAIIDVGHAFAHGQTYVALSRCRTLEGLVLSSPLSVRSVIQDQVVVNYNQGVRNEQIDANELNRLKMGYFYEVISDLFDIAPFKSKYLSLYKRLSSSVVSTYKTLVDRYSNGYKELERLFKVTHSFQMQYAKMIGQSADFATDEAIQERIKAGAIYFSQQLETFQLLLDETSVECDNTDEQRKIDESCDECKSMLLLKLALLKKYQKDTFVISDFLKCKSKLEDLMEKNKLSSTQESAKKKKKELSIPTDVTTHAKLYKEIYEWRKSYAKELEVKPYQILQQKTIIAICNALPSSGADLKLIPGIGPKKMESYGEEILQIIDEYVAANKIERPNMTDFLVFEEEGDEVSEGKKKKQNTKEISFEAFKEGHSIAQIAEDRGLTYKTIYNHLIHYIETGDLDIDHLVPPEIREYICVNIPRDASNQSLTELKQKLGDHITYCQLRAVLCYLGKD